MFNISVLIRSILVFESIIYSYQKFSKL